MSMRLVIRQCPNSTRCLFNPGVELFAGSAYEVKAYAPAFVDDDGATACTLSLVKGYGTSSQANYATATLAQESDRTHRGRRTGTLTIPSTAVAENNFVLRILLGTDVIVHEPVKLNGVPISSS